MPDGPRDLDSLRAAVAACRLCGDLVTPPGVIWARPHHRAAIIGQAPGSLEVTRQMPFVGPAGRRLREWLAPLGAAEEAAFHERFAVIAITKCYPGRSPSGRGDRLPSPAERLLCRPWSEAALRLLDPPLVIPVGRLAVDEWLGPAAAGRASSAGASSSTAARSCRSPTPPAPARGRTSPSTAS